MARAWLCYAIAKKKSLCVKLDQGVPKWHRVHTVGDKLFAVMGIGLGIRIKLGLNLFSLRKETEKVFTFC